MKKILMLLTLMLSLQSYAGVTESKAQDEKPKDVRLEKGDPEKDNKHPRTLIPITCVYADGTVQLIMLENLGEMELIVTNQTTGEQWRTVNNWVLQTSTGSGVYLVEIITEDGTTYWGTYTL